MSWTKPEFEEVCLAMEVTAYVNSDAAVDHDGARDVAADADSEAVACLSTV